MLLSKIVVRISLIVISGGLALFLSQDIIGEFLSIFIGMDF